ncbi:hypothetical protein PQJ75_13000 [Rhodoplanes sp. TEM]|uniref:Translation initiation factor IF-2 n=1 Tax=Rhodoplanes tepidamans TaxID=200616 RepID=A0ABT5J7K6_RHOTP|nr:MULTISPECIES: hypothetical protein [Rhodoplanes]MDC7785284.1 hypothetical protein [Rhodoplanes tepidamans]MDC7984649.1 hypothetical protein [Rhodoplanes sp. TEM]MDQ0353542.1 hypothetical protein [Rhodoplanes tepidamans]
MTSRYRNDFSLWPERARPIRRRFALSRIAGGAAVGMVCLVAGYAVVSEMTRVPDLQAPVGRSWDDYAATGAVAAGTVGLAPAGAAAVAPPVPAKAVATTENPRPRSRAATSPTGLAPIGATAPASPTDGRRVPDGRPPVIPEPTKTASESKELPSPKAAAPAPAAGRDEATPDPAAPPRTAIVAADDETPAVTEKPKPKKKVRRKPRTETAAPASGWGEPRRDPYARSGWSQPGWGQQGWGQQGWRQGQQGWRQGQRSGGFFPY